MNALEYAIKMENDGEHYYREQAELNQNNGVAVVSLLLAKAEQSHAQILKNKLDGLPYNLIDDDSYFKIKNIFKDLDHFKSEIKKTPSQLDFYRTALEIEKQSVDLYTSLLNNTTDKNDANIFQYLIDQEQLHFLLVDEIVTMLRHAEEWVESAEFGLRNEIY